MRKFTVEELALLVQLAGAANPFPAEDSEDSVKDALLTEHEADSVFESDAVRNWFIRSS